eukprot:TRINITY_DN685_c0_g1_i1.p1 TRINITY_DN685_c0_g1~~TRINITY_DN685_c0_g1_i1.p1  ORF type:complete len:777 (-),score=86.53 TRINITY_DN685_c0_g1_i1:140-2470(-)
MEASVGDATLEKSYDAVALRAKEFSRLGDNVYLDNAGSALYSQTQIDEYHKLCSSSILGNPHSIHDSSARTTRAVEATRDQILHFFNTNRKEYSVIFTSGATAGLKMVGECFPWASGSAFAYSKHCHNSVLGIREYCLNVEGANFNPTAVHELVDLAQRPLTAPSLVAIAAQCNFSGAKTNLQEIDFAFRASRNDTSGARWFTLLDAASWVSSSPLDLSVIRPDFVALSFYKIFGFPTGLGALIVRQDSLQTLNKTYFGGGTVAASLSSQRFHQLRPDFRRFEDGTSDFLGIISLKFGFSFLESLGGMRSIQRHTHALWRYCLQKMRSLRHASSNTPLIKIYGIPAGDESDQLSSEQFGPIISFNLVREDGKTWIGYAEVEKFASLEKIQVRTGCFCNPGACETFLQLDAEDVKRNLAAGHVCWDDKDVINGKPTGAIRLSIPYFATHNDIDRFIAFLQKYFLTSTMALPVAPAASNISEQATVERIVVYPIKSCCGFEPQKWPLCPEGFLYDREWTLIDEDGSYVNQKRLPEMAKVAAKISSNMENLVVSAPGASDLVIPLSYRPKSETGLSVCGDICEGDAYDDEVNAWFHEVLGERLTLVRKRDQAPAHQARFVKRQGKQENGKKQQLSFANEGQFLLVSLSSLRDLEERLRADPAASAESPEVSYDNFRPNIVINGASLAPYAEESWRGVSIANRSGKSATVELKAIGHCNRCSMICVDKNTGQIKREPLRTLASYRRDNGRIPFGVLFAQEASLSDFEGVFLEVGSVLTAS